MTLRALFAGCAILFAGLASATDYDLVVPRGWDYLKDTKTLVVYSPTNAFHPGDHITRIVPGGADGTGVRVSAGWPTENGTQLGAAGTVNGFAGAIYLSTDGTGASGLEATLVPAGQGATRAPEDNIAHSFPWIYVLGIGGVIVAAGAASLLLRKPQQVAAPLRFTGRKGLEEGVREIRAKIDEIQEEQQRLVRKPPVLRTFRKQIDGFDHRLRHLEAIHQETHESLNSIAGAIAKLDERLNNIAQHAVNASNDSKRSIEIVTKLSADQAKNAAAVEDKLLKSQDGFSKEIAGLGKRLDSLAAQGQAQDSKIQLASAGIENVRREIEVRAKATSDANDTTRKQIEKIDARLAASAEGAEATRASLKDVTTSLAAADKRLAGLEAQAQASAKRDEEAKSNAIELAKATMSLEQELSQLDTRVEGLAKSTESLHLNLQKSAEALQLNLQEISGRVSTTEGSLHANLQGLANELGTLRTEVGTLPGAMSSLGDRVGNLDARLTPITERGDKLAEGVLGLQSRFDDASKSLAKQVEALEARLEEVRSEGSKLANLPEVVSGNTAELTAHVRSAESGLKNLGEELAKLQESLLSGNKQSDGLADEISQRLSAWEGALKDVASKVEDLHAVEEDDEEEVVEKPTKKSRRAAAKAEAKAKKAQQQEEEEEEEAAPVAEEPPKLTVIENHVVEPVAEAKPPKLIVFQEPVLEEAPPVPQPVAQPAPVLEDINFDEEAPSPEEIVLERSKIGRWTELAGSSERLWSVKVSTLKNLPSVKGPIRPLTPIETPSVDHSVGALICTGLGTAFVHGNSLQSFWPGVENKSVELQSPVPNELWRLMMYGGYIYCAEERQVEIIHVGSWTKQAFFTGDYTNQAHTDNHWIGLMSWGDQLAVDFRDTTGNHINSPREIDAPASEQCYLAAHGNSAFVGTRSGSIFRVDPTGAVQLARPSDESSLLSISLTKAGILAIILGERGIEARVIGKDGSLLKSADLGCQVMAHAPVVIGDRFYMFDDVQSELITVSLKNLQITNRMNLESTFGVNRMIGLACNKTHLIAILGTDDRGVCTRAFVLDVKTGEEMTLCPINHPRAEMVAGDGHLVVASSSAFQNTIQVFNPFEAVDLKSKKAA